MIWAEMSEIERISAIRQGYLDGLSYSEIARTLRTTKDAVLGYAWRRGLNPANAAVWAPRKLRQASTQRDLNRHRRQPRKRPTKTIAERRAKLGNRAANGRSRVGVDLVNAMPKFDVDIAADLGVDVATVRKWRGGYSNISVFMLECIETLAARYAGTA